MPPNKGFRKRENSKSVSKQKAKEFAEKGSEVYAKA